MFSINGMVFDVELAKLRRTLRQTEKYRVTTEDGVVHREVAATYYDYAIQLGGFDQAAYDAIMAELSRPAATAVFVVPDGQGEVALEAIYSGVGDELAVDDGQTKYWEGLTLTLTAVNPL